MRQFYGSQYYGKANVGSRFGICDGCRSYTNLFSYDTARFFQLLRAPLIPLGHFRITDECPICGYCTTVAKRKYRKKRAKDFDVMMSKLKELPEYPDHVLNGLRTLMTYNEESWFTGMASEYARLFENHVQFQMVISEGLCRFGHYERAEAACMKAIELEAGKKAEELLSLCWAMEAAAKEQEQSEEMAAHKLGMYLPYLTSPLIISMVAGVVLIKGVIDARVREIWLINGSQIAYVLQLDNEQHELKRNELKKVKIRFGEHTAALKTTELPADTFALSYAVPSHKEAPKNLTIILNLDRMAVLAKETRTIADAGNQPPETEYLCGESQYTLTGIDIPFTDFPEEKRLKKLKQETVSRIYHHEANGYSEQIAFLQKNKPESVGVYARSALLLEPAQPTNIELLPLAVSDQPPEEALLFLRNGTTHSPVLPEWHQFYQDYIERHHPEYDLQTEYAQLCQKHPDTPIYYYLLGRILKNRTDAWLLFEKAEENEGVGGFGYNAIAYDSLCLGNFKQALEASVKALAEAPNNETFDEIHTQAQLAVGKYSDLLQLATDELEKKPLDGQAAAMKVKYLTLLGRHSEAVKASAEFSTKADNLEKPDESGIIWSHFLDATRYYAVGNIADYLVSLENSQAPNAGYELSLHAGNLQQAVHIFTQRKQRTYTDCLILYCAAKYHKHDAIAEAAYKSALLELENPDRYHQAAKILLESTTPPTAEQLQNLLILPNEKTIVAAALGFKFPAQKKVLFGISQKFNCNPFFPHQLLRKWTK